MAEPLIYGSVNPQGLDRYEVQFWRIWGTYRHYYSLVALGGSQFDYLEARFNRVLSEMSSGANVGYMMIAPHEEHHGLYEVPVLPLFSSGVEITVKSYGPPSDRGISVRLVPNSDFYVDVYDQLHQCPDGGEQVLKIVATHDILQLYVQGIKVHESDPRLINWDWAHPGPAYWGCFQVFIGQADRPDPDRVDGDYGYYWNTSITHIQEVSYSLPNIERYFFTRHTRAYEQILA